MKYTDGPEYWVPDGVLQPDTTYYWRGGVKDNYDQYHAGLPGQSTDRYSPAWSFKTQKTPPTPDVATSSPGNATGGPQVLTTLTPTLSAGTVTDPDSAAEVQYEFKLGTGPDGRSGSVVTSGLLKDSTDGATDGVVHWTVPTGTLTDGGIYSWIVQPYDGVNKNVYPTWVKQFKVDLRLGLGTPSPYDTAGPVGVNLANGNANLSFASPTVKALGGDMGMSFTYNSQEDRNATAGLTGEYFDARTVNGATPPYPSHFVFTDKTPLLVRQDPAISFNWGAGSPADSIPADYFMARWSGYIRVPTTGTYTFGVMRDDGARVWVGGDQVVNQWSYSPPMLQWGSGKAMNAGVPIDFRFEMFESHTTSQTELWVRDPSGKEFVVPSDWFTRKPQILPAGWTSSAPLTGDLTNLV